MNFKSLYKTLKRPNDFPHNKKRYKNEKLTDLMLTINLYIGIIFGRLIYLEYVFHAMISKFIGYNQVCNTDTGEPLFGVDLNFVLLDQ
jgi:hypothetical protein